MLKLYHYRINVIAFLSANNCRTTQLKHCKEMIPLGKNRLCYPEGLGNQNNKAALQVYKFEWYIDNLYVTRYG